MKSYKADEGGIVVVDRRQLTKGTIVPNFLIDIYLPIIKYAGLGLLTTIYRLTSEESSWNKLRDYMKAGSMGYEKLNELLCLFEKLGLIEVEKPEGANRIRHMRTTITILDAPASIPEEYRDVVLDATIAKWLFDTEEVEQNSFQVEQVEEEPVEKKTKEVLPQTVIKNAFLSWIPEDQKLTANHPKEGMWAKKFLIFLREKDWPLEFLIEQLHLYYMYLSKTVYWSDKSIWLANLHRDFGKWCYTNNIVYNPAGASPAAPGASDNPEWHPDWQTMDETHPDFWVVGTKLPFNDGTMECKKLHFNGISSLVYVDEHDTIIFHQKG